MNSEFADVSFFAWTFFIVGNETALRRRSLRVPVCFVPVLWSYRDAKLAERLFAALPIQFAGGNLPPPI
jgi:hypothetical protein